jgi:hypothetical protein
MHHRGPTLLGLLYGFCALSFGCGNGGAPDCAAPFLVMTQAAAPSVNVSTTQPTANAQVAVELVFQLDCTTRVAKDRVALAGVSLEDGTPGQPGPTLATLNVGLPPTFDGWLDCGTVTSPKVGRRVDLLDLGTPNAMLSALCGKSAVLSVALRRNGCADQAPTLAQAATLIYCP